MGKLKLKLIIVITASLLAISGTIAINKVVAYNESAVLGSSVLVCNPQLYIDGTKVLTPYTIVAAKSNKPSIFGYTQDNVTVHLTIADNPGNRVTTTDSNGYWIYNTTQPLTVGDHRLYMSISDSTGATSSPKMVATFNVPAVLGASATNDTFELPLFLRLNIVAVVTTIFAFVLILTLLYLLTRRFRQPEWKALL
jgi:hypothetical protein